MWLIEVEVPYDAEGGFYVTIVFDMKWNYDHVQVGKFWC